MRLSVSVFTLRTQSERCADYTPISEGDGTSGHSSISLTIKVNVSQTGKLYQSWRVISQNWVYCPETRCADKKTLGVTNLGQTMVK